MSLRYLVFDMNSFFASVEQQERSELRDRPTAVIPMKAQTTCCIAASYEAKACGVKTGTAVRDAKARCPAIRFVIARPKLYVQYHHRIIEAAESCLHIDHVCSIDEMYGRLLGREQEPQHAAEIAHAVKHAIRVAVGPYVKCSIGIGPNVWLAKVATDLDKPDGLAMILPSQLPEKIRTFALTDLPGIARGLNARLARSGITTVAQLYTLSESGLARIWGSRVLAKIWWHQLRGYDLPFRPTHRKTVGHSHVLPPDQRNDPQAYAVLARMIHKAAFRMRRLGYWAGRITIQVRMLDGPGWQARASLGLSRDTLTMLQTFNTLWQSKPAGTPYQVAVVLTKLVADDNAPLPFFPHQASLGAIADAMDKIDARYGPHTIYAGSMFGHQQSAPLRISYTQIPRLEDFVNEETC